MTNKATGGCLCGAVKYQVTGVLRPVVACHCTQCQKTSGHHVAATSAPRENIALLEEQGLKWYFSSKGIRRGFCQQCGGNLFWDHTDKPTVSIFAGTLDQPSKLKLVEHIYVEDKADYYEITDGLPQRVGFQISGGADHGE